MSIQDLLDAIASANIIFELPRLALHRLHGPLEKQAIARRAGWSGWSAQHELAQKGIHISGFSADKHTLTYYVSARQAGWARYVLHRAQAPVAGQWTDADLRARAKGQTDGPVPAWNPHAAPRGMWICKLLDLIAELI